MQLTNMKLARKLGLAGAAALLVVAGALLVGGSAGASKGSPPANTTTPKRSPEAERAGSPVNVAPGSNGIASVACPAGTIVTGGGGTTSAFRIFFTDSFKSGNSWFIRGTNTGSATEAITAHAVCAGTS